MRYLDVTSSLKGKSRICEPSPKLMEKALSAGCAITVTLALLLPLLLIVALPVQAQTLTTLHSFKGGSDGRWATGGLVLDAQGNVYGSTLGGGTAHKNPGYGAIYEVSASGAETILYSFERAEDGKSPGGTGPNGSLVRDSQGNFYGTTASGGANRNAGTAFKVSPSGTETVLHSFSGHRPNKKNPAEDGDKPGAGVILDGQGNLYGTTVWGGNYNCEDSSYGGCGAVFEVTQSGSETLLHSFNGGSDGASPSAPLIFDAEGNLYGTTAYGGSTTYCDGSGCGTVFKLSPSGTETVLYSFTGGADGGIPIAGLIFDGQGNLYGTTEGGGSFGYGTVFKLTASGTETVLYSFSGGADGEHPAAGVVLDSQGNLYGTAGGGLNNSPCVGGCGVIFEVSPSGTETVLYSFTGGDDGYYPKGPLVFDGQGNLYGTTLAGGVYGWGTVFKLTP